MPLSVTNTLHAHRLNLTFESPYGTKSFSCDICKRNGADHWLYRCDSCGFDAHLNCARTVQAPQQGEGAAGTSTRSIPQPHFPVGTPHLMQHQSRIPAGAPFMPQNGMNNNDLALQMLIQQVNNNNALVQAMLARGGAGGLGGNNNIDLQQLMRLMNNGGGGGIGGGGMDVLQSLMGGGGNGLDLLGGGGLDLGGLFGGFGF
ncbi:hypothetical protein ACJIZ3_016300 [Penstemon smallii]|uniref:DC1 domain-containing protein n=1 Tax=Penstemon smallii TaxID=265156 RepID=A0ABD3RSC5_9LAMI